MHAIACRRKFRVRRTVDDGEQRQIDSANNSEKSFAEKIIRRKKFFAANRPCPCGRSQEEALTTIAHRSTIWTTNELQ